MDLPNLITIETNYNPKAEQNTKLVFKRKDQENRWKATERERGFAKKCKYPKDLDDFNRQVRFFFSERR
jgi:hypothetical protein